GGHHTGATHVRENSDRFRANTEPDTRVRARGQRVGIVIGNWQFEGVPDQKIAVVGVGYSYGQKVHFWTTHKGSNILVHGAVVDLKRGVALLYETILHD